MIDRSEVSRALAKSIAYKQCGKQAEAERWARERSPRLSSRKREPRCRGPRPLADSSGVEMRENVTLQCGDCKRRNYVTTKNKKTTTGKLEFRKYCRFCRKHTSHKETK